MQHRLISTVLVIAMVVSVFATALPQTVPAAVALEATAGQQASSIVPTSALAPAVGTPIWQDTSYSFEERAADLVSRLTPAQRAAQMVSSQANAGVPITVNGQLIPAYGWWNEALHGISREQLNTSGNATTLMNTTSYPINQAIASSWDPELVYREAAMISDEAREVVRNNKLDLDVWSPTINLARDPRWGRNDESYGEDPLLTAALASQFVNGMEGKDMNGSLLSAGNGFYKTLTTLKHYAANNSEVNRLNGVSTFDERASREYYTAHFREIIQQSSPGSLMSSYNRISVAPDAAYSTPAAVSVYLMDRLARQTFGFNGYVTSDCDALGIAPARHLWIPPSPLWSAPVFTHTVTLGEIFSFGMSAGEDLECNAGYTASGNYRTYGPSSVGMHITTPSGLATVNDIDTSLTRLFTARMKLGEFDPEANVPWITQARARVPQGTWVNNNTNNAVTETPERLAMAREAGDKSIVLLKNGVTTRKDGSTGKLLPMQVPVTGTFKVLIIGVLGNVPNFYLGGYSSNQGSNGLANNVTPYSGTLEAIQAINPGATVDFRRGFTGSGTAASGLTMATISITDVNSAENYDYVLVYVGTDSSTADEAGDRPDIALPGSGGQAALISQVAAKNPNTIVFMETIGPVDVTPFEPTTSAILWSSYLAQRKGESIADVLLGTYNPSGHTSSIWYSGTLTTTVIPAITDYTLRPAPGIPGRTYMYYTGTLSYPFGYGLSFTDFSFDNLQISNDSLDANSSFQVSADITNTGTVTGAEVVQLYITTPDAAAELERPIKRLEGFQKVTLNPGETKTMTFTVEVPDLAFYDQVLAKWVVDNGRYGVQISQSSADADIVLQDEIQVTGSLNHVPNLITVKPTAEGDAAMGIPTRVIFPEGMVVVPNVTVAMNDDTLYGFIEPGSSQPFPAGMTFDYVSNRPGVVSVDGGGVIRTVAAGVATITATVTYGSVSQFTTFVVRVLPALSGITVNGTPISPFNPSVNNYDLIMPNSAITVPVVAATAVNPASVLTITQATAMPGLATIVVAGDEGIPVTYTVPLAFGARSDDFSSTTQGTQWSWIRPSITNTSLITTPGFLTINTQTGDLNTSTNTAKNILLQSVSGDWTIESKLVFSRRPAANTEQGGIIAYQDDNNYLKVGWEYNSTSSNRFNVTLEDSLSSGILAQTLTTLPANSIVPTTTNTVWFRMSKTDAIYRIYYSVDGITFAPLWTTGATLNPVKVGVFAYNRTGTSTTLNVAFDYFNVTNGIPTVNAGPDADLDLGVPFNQLGSFTDLGFMDAWTGSVDYGEGDGPQALALNPDKTFALSHLYAARGSYTVTVAITDTNSEVGTDTVRVGVNLPTTTTLTSSPNLTFYGEAVTFTATVTISGTGLPTGSVTFFDNGMPIGSGSLDTNGQATLTTTSLTGGTHTAITATYNGDANFRHSTSSAYTQTVNQVSTTTTLTSSPNPSVYGQTATFTATVAISGPSGPGAGLPTGSVTFFDNGVSFGSGSLDINGQAILSLTSLRAGAHNTITAIYSGSVNFVGSMSSVYAHSVNQANTTTTLTTAPNPSAFGQAVTFTAVVAISGTGTLTGTVTFFDNGTPLGTGNLNASNRATLSLASLSVGAHTLITATYSGNANSIGSTTSNTYTHTVNQANTTTSLTSSPNPSAFGQAVTFTATVGISGSGAGTRTGSVAFFDNGTPLGSGSLDANSRATLSLSSLALGVHNAITATYGGDTNFRSSTSSAYTQTVNQANTTTSLTSSPNPSVLGEAVTFTATVGVNSPGVGTPTGSVNFFDTGTLLGAGSLDLNGQATLSLASLALGVHNAITATYGGDASFIGSASNAYTHTVGQANTTTSLTSSPNPSVYGQMVTFTATVGLSGPGTGTPTGSVNFFDNGTSLGSGSLDLNGQATLSLASLAVGAHNAITATYGGDTIFAGSTSSAYAHTVNQANTITSLTSAPNPSIFGQTVTLTATVGVSSPGAGLPTGSITFMIGSTLITQTLSASGVAVYSTSALAVGLHPAAATYNGDTNFSSSTQTLTGGQVVTDTAIAGLTAANSSPTGLTNATFFTATINAGSNVTYQWNFGDGQTGSGATAIHTYAAAGIYTAIVTATNSAGSLPAMTTVYVTTDPIAHAGPDQTTSPGQLVTLNGSASTDPGNFLPLTYQWQQIGGPAVTLTGANNVTATFPSPAVTQTQVLTFELTVTNTQNIASVPDVVVITVEPYRILLPLVFR
jgi:beta-glucosidase